MDISKEYIEMCGKAKEIQDCHKPEGGDFIFITKGSYVIGAYEIDSEYNRGEIATIEYQNNPELKNGEYCSFIWLPRQDQLQEMIRKTGEFSGYTDFLDSFHDFVFDKLDHLYEKDRFADSSLEMYWLTFVMEHIYQKEWNRTEWVKIP